MRDKRKTAPIPGVPAHPRYPYTMSVARATCWAIFLLGIGVAILAVGAH